ncbi:OmpH family outer membrane protein [Marinomonas piezotolerans]|uniref:OmpH family outer membrane protein n=1 Tax=Marinomonas piezotolerans TaxID=2213058 RepID=A0A370UAD0_9GAMM|nr:OmpH family outer membrane protein [Marinomonas piezotolerans]RDL44747.1 OmpH family outer membrane protein [Marinomonas piezotolerans]
MKAYIGLVFAALISVQAYAAEIAVLDFHGALLQSNAGQEAAKAPRQQVDQMRVRLDKEDDALREMVESLKRDELTLAPEDVQKRRQAINEKQNQLRSMVSAMQQQAQQMEQKLIRDLTPRGEAALKEIIEERKLDAVLNRQAALYTNNSVDITAELIEKLNKEK